MLQSGEENWKWPTSGPVGYITLRVEGVPYASKRGTKLEEAQKRAGWLQPLPFGRSPMLRSRGQNQMWPTSGPSSYITAAV